MKTLCHSLPLLVLLSLTPCGAQQIALLDAPVPVVGESISAGEPGFVGDYAGFHKASLQPKGHVRHL
jgi:hypothetical protein